LTPSFIVLGTLGGLSESTLKLADAGGDYSGVFQVGTLTAERIYTAPNAAGTLALVTEIDAVETGTTYSLDADDLWRMKQFSNASGCAITVPSGLGIGFEEIFLHRQPTAGALTLTHSITIDNAAAISTVAAGGTCCLKRKASNHWILI
jgi:hypothetical protein